MTLIVVVMYYYSRREQLYGAYLVLNVKFYVNVLPHLIPWIMNLLSLGYVMPELWSKGRTTMERALPENTNSFTQIFGLYVFENIENEFSTSK